MNVIYKPYISRKLDTVIAESRTHDVEIDCIELTSKEFDQLFHEVRGLGLHIDVNHCPTKEFTFYSGIRLVKEGA